MPETPPVLLRLQDGVLTLTLARPAKKNALDLETLFALQAGIEQARDDPAVRVVVLAAEGTVFSAGGDIQVMRDFADDPQATVQRLRTGLNRLVTLLHELPKPVIAKVQGNAYGAGAVLAFQCDLAIVADDAVFSLSFRHVGLIPDTGGTWLLPRVLGPQRAKHLIWTAAPFTAGQAEDWGLVCKKVGAAELDGAVARLASSLAAGPTAAIGAAKHAVHANLDTTEAQGLEREARTQGWCFTTAGHREGRDAFFDRRKPDFQGAGAGASLRAGPAAPMHD